MTFPTLDTVNATNDLTQLFIYGNIITNNHFVSYILIAFFVVGWLGSFYGQVRLTGRGRLDTSFTASAFLTTSLSVLMGTTPGLVPGWAVAFFISMSVLGLILVLTNND